MQKDIDKIGILCYDGRDRGCFPISFQKELISVYNICLKTSYHVTINRNFQKIIDKVLKLIREAGDEIHWIITGKYPSHRDPTWAIPDWKEIYFNLCGYRIFWSPSRTTSIPHNFMGVRSHNDFFADIIMDELAHIKTGKDHGSKAYDERLISYHDIHHNKQKYFNPFPCYILEETFAQ